MYIGGCNIALLKLLTVLFIVGCNNRKLYFIKMYCLLLVVITGNYIEIGVKGCSSSRFQYSSPVVQSTDYRQPVVGGIYWCG